MGITEILRRIWLFSANKIKSSESFSKQSTQLIVKLNSSLRHIIVTIEYDAAQVRRTPHYQSKFTFLVKSQNSILQLSLLIFFLKMHSLPNFHPNWHTVWFLQQHEYGEAPVRHSPDSNPQHKTPSNTKLNLVNSLGLS